MSRTLARLRQETGDPLLVRAGRRLVPTPRADELRGRVHALVQDAQSVLRPDSAAFDLTALKRSFAIRANEGFLEVFAGTLVAFVGAVAPNVRLRFVPKPNKDVQALREGLIDLEIGVLGTSGPEIRVQSLFGDHFIGAARSGHPLFSAGEVTPERYVAYGHVVSSRQGRESGPVDAALAALGLTRRVVAVVPSFRAALAVASVSDVLALVTESFFSQMQRFPGSPGLVELQSFPLPVRTFAITIAQMWHPRLDADPAHRWLRSIIFSACRNTARKLGAGSESVPGRT